MYVSRKIQKMNLLSWNSVNIWVDRTWLVALYLWDWIDRTYNGNSWVATWAITYPVDQYGKYALMQWTYNFTLWTWTFADITIGNKMNFTQVSNFSWACTFSILWATPNVWSWIFWSNFDNAMYITNTSWNMDMYLRWSSVTFYSIWTNYWSTRYWQVHTVWFTYDPWATKFYVYLDWVLQNVWWTLWPTTFLTNNWYIGDNAVWWGNVSSCNKKYYRAWVWSRQLSEAEHLAFHNAAV